MLSWFSRRLRRLAPPPPSRILLDTRADLDQNTITRLERHVRWVARWRKSPAWQAPVDRIEINQQHVGKRTEEGWVTIGLCWTADTRRGPRPRQIWVDSRLNRADECDTLMHELSHAFCPAGTNHSLAFRETYIVAWALYTRAGDWAIRYEIRYHLQRYRSAGFWAGRAETKHLLGLVRAARAAAAAERTAAA